MAAIQGRRRNLQVMTALGVLAGGLYGYTLTVISGALIGMNLGSGPGGHLTAGEQGMVTSALLIGAALGSYLAGKFNDRFGPKHIILAGALLACFLHNSPAHLIRRGQSDQAAVFLESTRDKAEARVTMRELSDPASAKTAGFKAPWLRRVLIVGIGVAMINQLTGLNIVNYYAPTIFTDTLGFDPSLSMVATVPVILVSAIAATIGGLGLIDRFDRRAILAVGLAGTIVFLAAIGVCYRFVGTPGSGSRTAAWIMIGMMMIYVVFVQGLVAPVTWLLLSEIFPQQIKSRGMGYANVAMNLTNFGLSLVFPTLLARLGGTGTYLLFALINVCALVFAWIMVPETRGKSLAQIEQEARDQA